MKYLVDTDWVIEYLKGREPTATLLSGWVAAGLAVSLITYGEIYDGVFASKFPDQQEAGFQRFLQGVTLLSLNIEIMHRFAHLRGQLRRQGLLIASTALHYNLTLLTFNSRHFQRIPDLTLYTGKDQ